MLIIKDSIYNPKIDYLICKNLSIKKKYIFDEYRLRDVFNEKINEFLKDLYCMGYTKEEIIKKIKEAK